MGLTEAGGWGLSVGMNRGRFLWVLAGGFLGSGLGVSGVAAVVVELEGGVWKLVELNGKAVGGGGEVPTMQFDGGTHRVSGHSGVNRFGGVYEKAGEKLKFGPLMGTRMAGLPEAMQGERKFLAMLAAVTGWSVVDGELILSGSEGSGRFKR